MFTQPGAISRLKLLNEAIVEHERRKGLRILTGYPFHLTIEACDYCTLHCKFCPTGQGQRKSSSSVLSLSNFKKIMERVGTHAIDIEFHNWGEPLLNRDICALIGHAKTYGAMCALSTNFQAFAEKDAEPLIRSGLDTLVVSLDGVDQESYQRYRVGGSFDRAINNMKALVRKKKELKSDTPLIRWQYVVFRHNEKHIPAAKRMGKEVGVDEIEFKHAWIHAAGRDYEEWVPENKRYSSYLMQRTAKGAVRTILYTGGKRSCCDPWTSLTLDAEGNVFPCCRDLAKESNFGNVLTEPFDSIWNGPRYRQARDYIITRRTVPGADHPCYSCLDLKKNKVFFEDREIP